MPYDIHINELMGSMMVNYNVTVTNTGHMTGDDIVLAYVNSTVSEPNRCPQSLEYCNVTHFHSWLLETI